MVPVPTATSSSIPSLYLVDKMSGVNMSCFQPSGKTNRGRAEIFLGKFLSIGITDSAGCLPINDIASAVAPSPIVSLRLWVP